MTKKGDSSIRELDGMLKKLVKYVDKQLFGKTCQEGTLSNSGLVFEIYNAVVENPGFTNIIRTVVLFI
ncbi:MAG: hypothetical protein MRQ11_03335 [Candidatus Midichloria mitochondrii]|uniref:hypothetical protein n=1 Tax=Candidatus Midichloria mitochondrii TaxID=234827 RepID=UPI0011D26585|nr:hypothetical protein [Candidatus Midichloria mitochondrii]MDJ1256764.1 hypothetical protein [Candidatus Midichloria mitochondrii]MDJ1288473.1 hypothetical protein [Candidatus Midichloria mitochondrii]MDJ1298999.1 hypothetical protein [Candidatus Midichloria mitochondrii]MDJ1313162.1 hypothetical protein [Candidatus Midichloria mitochondrii]MDJ1583712.1 hypothetical protein [Candidatus Midichloria mitochondrii]